MQVREPQLEPDRKQVTGSKLGKEYKAVYCHPAYLIHLQTKYIVSNAELDEAQAGIKITGRNINNLSYIDYTTLMAKREEKLRSLLMKMI